MEGTSWKDWTQQDSHSHSSARCQGFQGPSLTIVPRTDNGRRTPCLDSRPSVLAVCNASSHPWTPTTSPSVTIHPRRLLAVYHPAVGAPSSYLDRFIVHSATAPPCNNGPAPRPRRLDLSSSNMASRDESGEPGASLSLPGSAGPISPTAPIRSLGSATDTCHPLRTFSLPAAPVRLPDDGVLSRSLATRAVQRPLPDDGRRLCSAARAPNTHRLRTRPGHQAQTSPSLAWEAEMCLLACDVATHAPTTTYEMHRLGGSECDVCSCRLGRGGGLLRDASFDQGTGRDLDHHTESLPSLEHTSKVTQLA